MDCRAQPGESLSSPFCSGAPAGHPHQLRGSVGAVAKQRMEEGWQSPSPIRGPFLHQVQAKHAQSHPALTLLLELRQGPTAPRQEQQGEHACLTRQLNSTHFPSTAMCWLPPTSYCCKRDFISFQLQTPPLLDFSSCTLSARRGISPPANTEQCLAPPRLLRLPCCAAADVPGSDTLGPRWHRPSRDIPHSRPPRNTWLKRRYLPRAGKASAVRSGSCSRTCGPASTTAEKSQLPRVSYRKKSRAMRGKGGRTPKRNAVKARGGWLYKQKHPLSLAWHVCSQHQSQGASHHGVQALHPY